MFVIIGDIVQVIVCTIDAINILDVGLVSSILHHCGITPDPLICLDFCRSDLGWMQPGH